MSKNLLLIPIVELQLSACASDNKRAATGVGTGAAAGAGIGAIVGNQYGKSGTGALNGGAFGTGVGGVIGHRMDTQAKELKKVAETKRTESGIVSKLKSDILFDPGKNELAVRDALVTAGVPAASVHVIRMGSAQPVASNSDANGRAQNRRVEIDIKADPKKLPADRPASVCFPLKKIAEIYANDNLGARQKKPTPQTVTLDSFLHSMLRTVPLVWGDECDFR